jgi:hypothetical protein
VSSLRVELAVLWLDDSKYGMVIGQAKVGDSLSKKPVAELFYNRARIFTVGVSQIPDVGSLKMTEVGQIEVGKRDTTWSTKAAICPVDDEKKKVMSTGQLNSSMSYFKVGNYNQGNELSEVVFYDIAVQHG